MAIDYCVVGYRQTHTKQLKEGVCKSMNIFCTLPVTSSYEYSEFDGKWVIYCTSNTCIENMRTATSLTASLPEFKMDNVFLPLWRDNETSGQLLAWCSHK